MSVVIRSIITVVLFSSFIGLWIWAWRTGRNGGYASIAQLPLQDDALPDFAQTNAATKSTSSSAHAS